MLKRIVVLIETLLLVLFAHGCSDEEDYEYILTVDGYFSNFAGYYYIDGSLKGHFNGEPAYTDSHGYTFYYYEKELEEFNSIKVFANKDDPACSLTVTLWKDEEEVASSSSGSYAGYNDDDGTYELSVDPLYYSVDDDEDDEEEDG
jgi:hypothetical protein